MEGKERKKEINSDDSVSISPIVRLIRNNFVVYIVCLLAVLACMVIYLNGVMIVASCMNDCRQQFESKCYTDGEYIPYNNSIGSMPVLDMGNWES